MEALEARVVPAVGKWYPVPPSALASIIAPTSPEPIQIQLNGATDTLKYGDTAGSYGAGGISFAWMPALHEA